MICDLCIFSIFVPTCEGKSLRVSQMEDVMRGWALVISISKLPFTKCPAGQNNGTYN